VTTVVVNIKQEICDVYVGRGSIWGNKFSHVPTRYTSIPVATREEAIERYRTWIVTQPHLMARLHELRGKILGCFCKPENCHGDVLASLADGLL
jgi:hypothetical protein